MTLEILHEKLLSLGAKPQHIQRLYRSMMGIVAWPSENDLAFPKKVRDALADLRNELNQVLTVVAKDEGEEGASLKLLFRLTDGHTIESVLLPREGVCVSTQVGCAVG